MALVRSLQPAGSDLRFVGMLVDLRKSSWLVTTDGIVQVAVNTPVLSVAPVGIVSTGPPQASFVDSAVARSIAELEMLML